jgi:hypothetical protein
MTKPDRNAFARKHAIWLVPMFGAMLALGFLRENGFAVGAGIAGLIWVVWAIWTRK